MRRHSTVEIVRRLVQSTIHNSRNDRTNSNRLYIFPVVHLAGSAGPFANRCRRLHNLILPVYDVGVVLCIAQRIASANVCAIRLRFRYPGDQDDSIWIHYQRLSRQMDAAGEIGWTDVVRIGWTVFGQGRSNGTHRQLHWYVTITRLLETHF